MRAKSLVLIMIALGCGLVASIAISQVMERGANSGNGKVETVPIYVATTDIDMNEQLTAENVRMEEWPKSKIPEGAITSLEDVTEQFARTRLYEGEPIVTRKLADGISGPAIKIPPGCRVCSLTVRMDTAVSYLVKPGDRVDIFGYFKAGRDIPKTGTQEILRNVRVFAINSETEQGVAEDGKAIIAKTVSVLVQQEQVARLMLAAELGNLRLVLRRPNEEVDNNVSETATIESLFGSKSENADADAPAKTDGQKAGGFAKFLSGLAGKSRNTPMTTPISLPMAPMQIEQKPAWQMTVLTPDGGTEFTWKDETGLPETGGNQQTGWNGQPTPFRSRGLPVPGSLQGSSATANSAAMPPRVEEAQQQQQDGDSDPPAPADD